MLMVRRNSDGQNVGHRLSSAGFASAFLSVMLYITFMGRSVATASEMDDNKQGGRRLLRHRTRTPVDVSPDTMLFNDDGRASRSTAKARLQRKLFEERIPEPSFTRNYRVDNNDPPFLPSRVKGPSVAVTVSLRLSLPSVGSSDGTVTREDILVEQSSAIEAVRNLIGAKEKMEVMGQTQLVLNSVFVRFPDGISNGDLDAISNNVEGIQRITPMGTYKVDMSETVDHIGARLVQNQLGYDGTGVKVGVLDTGVDYTHKNLGGEGTVNAYIAAIGTDPWDKRNQKRDGMFPTAKVVNGYDFVGEISAGEDEDEYIQFDNDPIDAGGHGTSVADTIAGVNGIAPGASIIAIKVCAGQGGCPGMSIAMGLEYAIEQGCDIINLSLGSEYGQAFDDELVHAIDAATAMGTLTIASSGNCGDAPYCTGTPGTAFTAVSVGQTTAPGKYKSILSTNADEQYNATHFPWTVTIDEHNTSVEGRFQYADGRHGNQRGCDPFDERSLEGLIVMVDRGGCFFSEKVRNIEAAGGLAAIVANNVKGTPFPGAFGGGETIGIPGFMVSLEDGNALFLDQKKETFMSIDFANFVATAHTTIASSARGPDMSFSRIKPEIVAPGANMVAEFGTGDKEEVFGGTSGAAPVIAGVAALLKQMCPNCSPLAIKAMLMNTSDSNIKSDTSGEQAEVTRIGAGEVRADAALGTTFFAYNTDEDQPSLSLGLIEVTGDTVIKKSIRIINMLQKEQTISFKPVFRDHKNSDKIRIKVFDGEREVSNTRLGVCEDTILTVKFYIRAENIESNHMNSGSQGDNPSSLTANEVDGYLVMQSAFNEISIPWHALARKASKLVPKTTTLSKAYPEVIRVQNEGAGIAQIDIFDLVALSDDIPEGEAGAEKPTPDIRAVGVRTLLADTDECTAGFAIEFAINTWERQAHLVPITFYLFVDTNGDGELDYAIWNGLLENDAKMMTMVTSLESYDRSAQYFTEHATNSANSVLRVCGEQLGLDMETDVINNRGVDLMVEVEAYDYLYGGPGDVLASFTMKPFGERFTNNVGNSDTWYLRGNPKGKYDIGPGEEGTIEVYDMRMANDRAKRRLNDQSYGALAITNSNRGMGARGAATADSEAILLLAPDVVGPKELKDSFGSMISPRSASEFPREGIVCHSDQLKGSLDPFLTKSALSDPFMYLPSRSPTRNPRHESSDNK